MMDPLDCPFGTRCAVLEGMLEGPSGILLSGLLLELECQYVR
jgi:hypothetical protein